MWLVICEFKAMMLLAMKTVNVICTFRSVHCQSLKVIYCLSNCQLCSHSLIGLVLLESANRSSVRTSVILLMPHSHSVSDCMIQWIPYHSHDMIVTPCYLFFILDDAPGSGKKKKHRRAKSNLESQVCCEKINNYVTRKVGHTCTVLLWDQW